MIQYYFQVSIQFLSFYLMMSLFNVHFHKNIFFFSPDTHPGSEEYEIQHHPGPLQCGHQREGNHCGEAGTNWTPGQK